jgi:hypothetical protein
MYADPSRYKDFKSVNLKMETNMVPQRKTTPSSDRELATEICSGNSMEADFCSREHAPRPILIASDRSMTA